MLCKFYILAFEFLRATEQESLVYVQKIILEKKILCHGLERILHLSSSDNKDSYPVIVTEIVSHFKWSFKKSKAVF